MYNPRVVSRYRKIVSSKEFFDPESLPPATPQELVARALEYIDEDGKVRRKIEDGSVIVSGPFAPFDLDALAEDVWLHTLLSVAWVLFRQHRGDVTFDEESLQLLAIYLGAYYHDKHFLETACSLIRCEGQVWESPSLRNSQTSQSGADTVEIDFGGNMIAVVLLGVTR